MVFLFTSSTVCTKFKIQLLALSLVMSIHHILLRFLNLCIGYLLAIVLILRFVASLIVLSLHEPHYLSSLFSLRSNYYSLLSSSSSLLLLPYFNKKSHGFRLFSYDAPYLWNYLPNNICIAPTYVF